MNQKNQEQNEWCWAATSQSILEFYGVALTQSQIASYGTLGVNTWNWIYGWTTTPVAERKGVNLILTYFGGISNSCYGALAQGVVQDEIDNKRPIVIRWEWTGTGGSGHILVGKGLVGDTM